MIKRRIQLIRMFARRAPWIAIIPKLTLPEQSTQRSCYALFYTLYSLISLSEMTDNLIEDEHSKQPKVFDDILKSIEMSPTQ